MLVAERLFAAEFLQDAGRGDDVLLAIPGNARQVVFFPVHPRHVGPGNVVFGRGHAENGGQQVEGSVGFSVAEFPQLHGVVVGDFPGLFAGHVELRGQLQAVDEQAAAEVGKVEFLAVVGAEGKLGPVREQAGKVAQQLLLVVVGKAFHPEAGQLLLLVHYEVADRDAHHLAKLCIDAGLPKQAGGGEVVGQGLGGLGPARVALLPAQAFALVLPEVAQHLVEVVVAIHAGHGFNVDNEELVERRAVKVLHGRRSNSG